MKTFKGFDKDLRCRGFQYEVGKTYKCNGKIELCSNGFHAIVDDVAPLTVFDYYPPADENVPCETIWTMDRIQVI